MSKLRLSALLIVLILGVFSVKLASAQTPEATYTDPCTKAEAAATAQAAAAATSKATFEIILPNARGDRSFIDSAAAGAERAIKELGMQGKIIETAGVQEHD